MGSEERPVVLDPNAAAEQGQDTAAEATGTRVPADPRVKALAFGLTMLGFVIAVAWDASEDAFAPRLATVDALAGLFIAAALVDRLVTFIPPIRARAKTNERAADLDMIRFGYGAVLGAIFVSLTDLHAADPLTANEAGDLGVSIDRGIATLAIAGGTVGLKRLLNGVNPPTPTSNTTATNAAAPAEEGTKLRLHAVRSDEEGAGRAVAPDGTEVVPPPTPRAYMIGALGLAAAALIALTAIGDKKGSILIGSVDGVDGVVVRFGLVIIAAGLVEQLVERFYADGRTGADKPLITGAMAVVLGVAAARVFDIYLLHNVGFFGVSVTAPGTDAQKALENVLSAGPGGERWLDTFVTGLVIAGGTKAVHDLGSRLRKAPEPAATEPAQPARGGG